MTSTDREDGRDRVYARLAEQEDVRFRARTPPPWAHWAGRALCIAILLVIVIAVLRVHPW